MQSKLHVTSLLLGPADRHGEVWINREAAQILPEEDQSSAAVDLDRSAANILRARDKIVALVFISVGEPFCR